MGIFSELLEAERERLGAESRANPLNNPAVPLSSPALWQWLTGGEPTASGETVTDMIGLQITTVYRCVTFIATAIASLPLDMWKIVDGGRQKAVDQDLFYLLLTEPNPEMSAFTFKETWFGCCALTGNGYAQIERDNGRPVALWPLHPHKTKPVRKNNVLLYETSDGEAPGKTRFIPAEDVLHIPLFSLDGICGLSPIGLMRQAMGLTRAAEKFGARFFGNGSRPGGVLTSAGPKPDPTVQREILESWNNMHGGTNQGKTAFLFGAEWKYQQIGLSPEDSQFLATRIFQRADIASLWGVPPHYVGDTSRMSGNNAENEGLRVVTDTLRPYLSRGENEIQRKLMPQAGRNANRYFVSFDVSERLRGDFKTQQEGYAAGVQWGWFSPNDVRRKIGENPGPEELDVYRVPVNMQSAKTLLTTESIQDVPLPGLGDGSQPSDVAPPTAPTASERKLLGAYAAAFSGAFSRAFRSLYVSSGRDSKAIRSVLGPIIECIAGMACTLNDVSESAGDAPAMVEAVLKGIQKRAAAWPEGLDEASIGDLAGPEFLKAVRSLHINAARRSSAEAAEGEVEE